MDEYEKSINAIEDGAITEDFEYEERVLYSQLLFEGAKLAQKLGDLKRAANWSSEHTRLYYSSSEMLKLYGLSVLALNEPVEPYVRAGGDVAKNPVWWTVASQIRELAKQKQASDQWLANLVDHVIKQKKQEDPDAPWVTHEDRVRTWLNSRQTWSYFGPYPIAESKNELTSIDDKFEPETNLSAGRAVGADGTIEYYTGGAVDLRESIADKDNVVVYLKGKFWLQDSQTVFFKLGADDAVKIWIDGKLVHRNADYVGIFLHNDKFEAKDLSEGEHTILMKITQGPGEWGFMLDAADKHNGPLPIWSE